MSSKFYLTAISCCVSALLMFENSNAQFRKEIRVYPYTAGSREDSLRVTIKRVKELLRAQRAFEKTYLNKRLVFMPAGPEFDHLFLNQKLYLTEQEFKPLLDKDAQLREQYMQLNLALEAEIAKDDSSTKVSNEAFTNMMKQARNAPPGHQMQMVEQQGLNKLEFRKDFLIVLCRRPLFLHINKDSPIHSYIQTAVSDQIEQELLGKPYDLNGYINSSNYIPFVAKLSRMPPIVEQLIQQNLALWKYIINDKAFQKSIRAARIDDHFIPSSSKLWLNTDVPSKTIYISPYLIRAVFNISFYQDSILRLADRIQQNDEKDGIDVFFHHKSPTPISRIDYAYYDDFVERFSENIFFVIGHELAHIYLGKRYPLPQIEVACDCYAAYYCLKHFGKLQPGLFDTLLISAIKTHELNFWGDDIDPAALQSRYDNLETISRTKSMRHAPVQPPPL